MSSAARAARPKYQIFISSTFGDLRDERKEVTWAVLGERHIPAGMESFPATDDRGWKIIQRTIDLSDYYVVLVAGRYGSVDPKTGLSWTEREYDYAVAKAIPVLAFIRTDSSTSAANTDRDDRNRVERLHAFKVKLRGAHHCAEWEDAKDLVRKVTAALHNTILDDEDAGTARPGWFRGDQVPSLTAMGEFARLSEENSKLRDKVVRYTKHSRATNTRNSYEAKMAPFRSFCAERSESSVPAKPETVVEYLDKLERDGLSVSTVNQFLSALGEAYEVAGLPSPRIHPVIQKCWQRIRSKGPADAPDVNRKKPQTPRIKPLFAEDIAKMLAATPDTSLLAARDRAIVALGWACAMRPRELIGVCVEHLSFHEQGFTLLVERDVEGGPRADGSQRTVRFERDPAICPVRILKRWINASQITEGPIFRPVSRWGRVVQYGKHQALWPQYVEKVVKRLLFKAGIADAGYGGSSLRQGFIMQAMAK